MQRLSLASLVFVFACGVTNEPTEQDVTEDPQSFEPQRSMPGGTFAVSGYRIVPVPTGIAFGSSNASKLIGSGTSVVGTAS